MRYMQSTLEDMPLFFLIEYLEEHKNEYIIADGHLQIILSPIMD